MADVICSPRAYRKYEINFDVDVPEHDSNEKEVKNFARESLGSHYQRAEPMKNNLVKEHFWSFDFIKSLNKSI